ncbi:DUF6265 family protein [Galbibacter sp. EGI 63066]|uniref:YciI family protein n=1 Tax=Galbibacter sp. EGI 63066 TaxID=2993559 RepID=UPI00224979A6|nr:DUF6265 family protein [Galbibacter sp. EGI 63066]MCX2682073.1 DUF6265 family protein [Galbibacter sp. EGI 63066]
MQQLQGIWVADNTPFFSDKEPYKKYVIEWKYALGNTSIVGRLYGITENGKEYDFWQFRQYWDNENQKTMLNQFGYGNIMGRGEIKSIESNRTESIQTFSQPDGTIWKEKHITLFLENKHSTTSFSFIDNKWQEKQTYDWYKQKTTSQEKTTSKIDPSLIENFPEFLQGTWKIENKETYEHWDKLNNNTLKGFSYKIESGQISISEYLDISRNGNETIYTATVLNQNKGRSINFKLTKSDSTYTFENPKHDFPKKIVYQKLSNTEVFVKVSDGNQKRFAYKMIKQNVVKTRNDSTVSNPNYDKALAQKLGADDNGMKSYIFVILKTGTNQTTDKALINKSFRGHLDNINRLVEEGKLIVAGPFGKNDDNYRGIFILDVTTVEDAEKLLQTDPAIKAGLLDIELYSWYGSAALSEYLEASDKIWKVNP